MNYEKFNTENFLEDQEFLEWVLNPNPQNEIHWKNVIKNNQKKENEIRIAVEALKSLNAHVTDSELEEDAKSIWQQIEGLFGKKTMVKPTSNDIKSSTKKYWLQISASVLVVLGLSWWVYPIINEYSQSSEEVVVISKSNPKGKKSRIALSDGSVILLNAESRIQYPENYGEQVREISLEGEAFFEVSKNANTPFVVKTKNVTTTALGTSFNISNYPENESILISLATGKISVKEEKGTELK